MLLKVGNLSQKGRHSTFPLQYNIDIALGHTTSITFAFTRLFHLDNLI